MGGTIRIIKKKDGEFKSYQGWTNPIPVFTFTSKFYKDKEYVNEKIENWGEEDENPNFDRSEYGVIFIDIDDKKIHECQGYSSIGQCHKSSVELAMAPNCYGYEYVLDGVKEFIGDGSFVYKADIYDKVGDEYILKEQKEKNVSYNDVIEMSKDRKMPKKKFINDAFYVDFSKYGWEVNSWMDNKPFEFFYKLIEDGYDISSVVDFETWDRSKDDKTPSLKSRLSSIFRDKKISEIL